MLTGLEPCRKNIKEKKNPYYRDGRRFRDGLKEEQ
jgi:hypothetical protein